MSNQTDETAPISFMEALQTAIDTIRDRQTVEKLSPSDSRVVYMHGMIDGLEMALRFTGRYVGTDQWVTPSQEWQFSGDELIPMDKDKPPG